jgi:hypothetical protein
MAAPPTSADQERAFDLFLVVVTWLAVTAATWTARLWMGAKRLSEPAACHKCGRARTDGLSIPASYQQHVVSCKGPGQMRSEAQVCPCGKSFRPWHKLNFER